MYNLCIFLLDSPVQYLLNFKEESTVNAARENIHAKQKEWMSGEGESITTIKDDYGQSLDIITSKIATVYIESLEKMYWKNIDAEILKRKVDGDFLKKRNDDLELIKLFPQQSQLHQGGHA